MVSQWKLVHQKSNEIFFILLAFGRKKVGQNYWLKVKTINSKKIKFVFLL